jgi:glycerol-3-phosphate dehydrogenase (NAD(P)+)
LQKQITVLGDGGWGTTLAILLFNNGQSITLWSNFPAYAEKLRESRENPKFLPGVHIPEEISITSDPRAALEGKELAVVAVPTQYLRSVLGKFAPCWKEGLSIVSVAKGIEVETLLRPSEIIGKMFSGAKICVLSGPSHAEEVASGLPTTIVAASRDEALAQEVQALFSNDRFRVYTNPDMLGVELAGALKNVIALAAGICEGLGFGDNAKAAILTRGLAEISRLGVAMGAKAGTFAGLSGIGDLITTCISPYGRNRRAGMAIGQGKSLDEVLKATEMVAEGIPTTKAAKALARKHNVEMPITQAVYEVLYGGKEPAQAASDLMTRLPRSEVEGLG